MNPNQQPEIVRRLRCAAGHLEAVIEMAEAGQPCEQVIHQLGAVQGALRAAMSKLIACEVQTSETIILDSRSSRKRIAQLKRLQSLYTLLNPRLQSNEASHD
ncbi:MAG: metal-sensing transcriptional repressor [Chloroflexota bacterium]